MNYEQSIARLEEIIALLSSSTISLEYSLELFAEGAKLIKQCNGELTNAKLKIEEVALSVEGL